MNISLINSSLPSTPYTHPTPLHCMKGREGLGWGVWMLQEPQTPSISLQHLSSNHCHDWLCHMSLKLSVKFVVAQLAVGMLPHRQLWLYQAVFLYHHSQCLGYCESKQKSLKWLVFIQADMPNVYMHTLVTLCCFNNRSSTQTFVRF